MPGIPPILVNGLTGSAAGILIAQYHLGKVSVEITVTPKKPGGGGGSAAGVMPDRTKSWDEEAPRSIIVRVTYNKKTTEKIYLVSNKSAEIVIGISNFFSRTREKIIISIGNIKRKTINILAKFRK